MKGCGFHQSDVAHHLHWGLVVWTVEFSVSGVAPPCVSFEPEAEACFKGQTLTPSERKVAKAGQTAVSRTGIG